MFAEDRGIFLGGEMAHGNPSDQTLNQLLADLTPKQAAFLHHYLDPHGPAFGNATKAAELAGYAGEPGGVQLGVQGHRTLRNPAVQQCLQAAFAAAGCTLELDAQVIREAMGATRTKYILGKNNQIMATAPQPDHTVRLRAVDLRHRLLRASRNANPPEPVSPSASDGITQPAGGDEVSPECADVITKVAGLNAIDRVLLRDVAESDKKLANSEAPEQDRGGHHE